MNSHTDFCRDLTVLKQLVNCDVNIKIIINFNLSGTSEQQPNGCNNPETRRTYDSGALWIISCQIHFRHCLGSEKT